MSSKSKNKTDLLKFQNYANTQLHNLSALEEPVQNTQKAFSRQKQEVNTSIQRINESSLAHYFPHRIRHKNKDEH